MSEEEKKKKNKPKNTKKQGAKKKSTSASSGSKKKSGKKKGASSKNAKKPPKKPTSKASLKKKNTGGKTVNKSKKSDSNSKKKIEKEIIKDAAYYKAEISKHFVKTGKEIKKVWSAIVDWLKNRKNALKNKVSDFFERLKDTIARFFRSETWKTMVRVAKVSFYTLSTVILVVFIVLFSLTVFFKDKILVNTSIAGVDVSYMTMDEAREMVKKEYDSFAKESFLFDFEGTQYKLTLDELLISEDIETSIRTAYWYGHTDSHFLNQKHMLRAFIIEQHVPVVFDYNMGTLEQQLEQFVEEISVPPKDAEIVLSEDGEFQIIPAKESTTTDFEVAYHDVIHQLNTLHAQTIELPSIVAEPDITDEEAEIALDTIEGIIDKTITITYDAYHKSIVPYVITLGEDKTWITTYKEDGELRIGLDDERINTLLTEEIVPQVNQEHHDATIQMPEEGERYATLDGRPSDGFDVQIEDTLAKIQDSLWIPGNNEPVVELVVDYKEGLILDENGEDVGMKDLLAVGKSNFDGSSGSRIFNIEKGLGLYNNLVLAPEEEFSFNEILGPVTFANGWKAELAIFSGGHETRPVAGGGLCQVSTTMYRAAIESGLSVVERRPHSYLVSYYVKDSDPRTGIDATIYPGSQDLRFVNDTPGYILIQTYTDGNDAYVLFYGTSDGREVALDGPYKSGWISPGGPSLEPTSDLPPGEVKITKAAHYGRTITWYQTITRPDGTEEKQTIHSNYRAIPAKGLIGAGGTENEVAQAE